MAPIAVVFRIAVIIFIAEGAIMAGLSLAGHDFSPFAEAVIDAAVLTLLSSPPAYFWVIRPYITARNRAEKTLKTAYDEVEVEIERRTLDLTREVTRRKEAETRLETEINAARRMQVALLPSPALLKEIEAQSNFRIESHFETSSELGGDLWGIHDRLLKDNNLGVFIVDFTGHGVGAAMNTFRLHTIMNGFRPSDGNPAAYLTALNDQLVDLLPTGHFATIFYGIINTREHFMTYSAAASPPPIIGREGSLELDFLDTGGLPLGIKKDVEYRNRRVNFPPGSFFLMYSDALLETPSPDGSVLSEEDVKEMLRACLSHESSLKCLINSFREKTGGALHDDLTAVLAKLRA
ncbi:MAG: hypothetical protein A3G18_05735 [Rhodospirillales bacterium RIFCSPLOWO2_12_FULL_58_28]|nr:MAG: hypothetical protein A3H92_00040 [Rhodospirillales bacterium RIFCSPLOWO2_02_FULL_58_16]OHC79286.1 MAG: hypothetical protein A3G18_05735 [Rhodospirillales bacterium RIFCSPLOWO2_12_FULL_58_28]